jgi:hypothetical protein
MKLTCLLVLWPVLLQAQEAGRIQELIRNLDDDSFEVREAAERELIAIGPAAIPSLKAVIADADRQKDKTELKIRATSALRGIEFAAKAKQYYVEPKLVTLKARDADLGQVLTDLEKQTGVRIQSGSVDPKAKVTLGAENAPLFRVLDDLCRGREDRAYEYRDDGVHFSSSKFVEYPSSYEGPYRFRIVKLRHEHSTDFKTREGQVELALEADWLNPLKPSKRVEMTVQNATDDKGATLEAIRSESDDEGNNVLVAANGRILLQRAGNPGGAEAPTAQPVQVFFLKGLRSGATRVSLSGKARFRFPLEKSDLVFDKPATADALQEGGYSFSLRNQGTNRVWRLTLTAVQGGQAINPEDVDGCIDRESIVAVDDAGKEHPATLHSSRGSDRDVVLRGGQVPAGTPLAVYQVVFPTLEERAVKTIRFKVLTQVFVKTVPFAFNDIPLP